MADPAIEITDHAAQRIVERELDREDVLKVVAKLLPLTKAGRKILFRVWPYKIVLDGNVLVTVAPVDRKDDRAIVRRKLRKRKRRNKKEARRRWRERQ